MTTTNFTSGTVIASTWLNDVDDITYRKAAEWVSVKDPAYGAVGDGTTDDTTAVQAAINSGKPVFFPAGVYKVTSTLTNADDLVLYGEPGSVIKDFGNAPVDVVLAANQGALIKYTGTGSCLSFNADVATRCAISDICFYVGDTYSGSIIKLEGCQWYLYTTGVSPQTALHNVSFYRDSQATAPGSCSATAIEFDLDSAVTPRSFFGVHVQGVFAFGLNEVYKINLTATGPTGGNWFNGNCIGMTHAYKCYRIANIIAGTTGDDQVSMNHFGPWFIQPAADNGGTLATGTLRLVNNVNRNTFTSIMIFDQATGRRIQFTNPYSANNQSTWNKFLNCADFEVDSNSQQMNTVEGLQQSWTPSVMFAGSDTGVTYTVNIGKYVRQGVLAHVEADITLNALGAAAGGSAVTISLPVEKASGAEAPIILFLTNGAGTFYGHAGTIGSGGNVITLYKYATSGTPSATAMTKTDLQTGTTLRLSATYPIRI